MADEQEIIGVAIVDGVPRIDHGGGDFGDEVVWNEAQEHWAEIADRDFKGRPIPGDQYPGIPPHEPAEISPGEFKRSVLSRAARALVTHGPEESIAQVNAAMESGVISQGDGQEIVARITGQEVES
jgi:hypothetical protein